MTRKNVTVRRHSKFDIHDPTNTYKA